MPEFVNIQLACRRDGERVRVFFRRGIDHTDRAPATTDALLALNVRSVTIDGEGVTAVLMVSATSTGCEPQWGARARAKRSCTPSTTGA
jgi:hypothetical protein